MKLQTAKRSQAKIKMALQGSAGSGKTMSALLIARGLTSDNLEKVAVIDTENGSSNLYAHLGNYNVLSLEPPYTPEKYIEAIDICLKSNMGVIIIDSISHCWDELLDFHSKLPGNSFANWNKVTPRQKAFVDKILQSPAHFIATMRTKQDYVLNQKDGKYVPEKVGLKAVQRDGVEYEFTLVFDIDSKHFATASKDRTNLFNNKPDFLINSSTGKRLLEWCNSGFSIEIARKEISGCNTLEELRAVFEKYQPNKQEVYPLVMKRKNELEGRSHLIDESTIVEPTKINENGTHNQ